MPWKEENYFLSTAYIENVYRVLEQIGIDLETGDWRGEPGTSFMQFAFSTAILSEIDHILRQNL